MTATSASWSMTLSSRPERIPRRSCLASRAPTSWRSTPRGDLVLHVPGGAIRQHKPVIYQEIDGIRQEIAGSSEAATGRKSLVLREL